MDRPEPSDRPVLVLDFGSQFVQLIARRVRERHAFARIVRHDITVERVLELDPLAIILSGGPSSVYEAGAPHCDPRLFSLGRAGPGDLLRDATGLRGFGRQGRAEPRPGIRPGGVPGDRPDRPAVSGGPRVLDRLDEPRRPGPRRGRGVRRRSRRPRLARSRPSGIGPCPSMGSSSTRRSATPITGCSCWGTSSTGSARAPGRGRWTPFLDRAVETISDGRPRRAGRLRALGRGRLGGLRGVAGEGSRVSGRLRVRRQRPAPLGRAGGGGRGVRRALDGRTPGRRRGRPLPQ